MRQAHGRHHDAPYDHDGGQEDTGPQALEEYIGQRLETGVGDEEDGEAGVVATRSEVEIVGQAVEFSVANVRTCERLAGSG